MSLEKYVKNDFLVKDEAYSVIENQVTCPICCEIKLNPKMCTNCQNTFCGKCAGTLKSCPFKCETSNCIDSRLTKELLSKLSFKCINGCDKIIKFDDLKNHYDNECEKIDFKEKYVENKELIAKLEQEIKNLKINNQENYEQEINELKNQNLELSKSHSDLCRKIQENSSNITKHIIKRDPHLKEVKSIFHEHKLIYKGNDYLCLCDFCRREFPIHSSFNCNICKFDLCEDCIDYPNTPILKAPSIHKHPLIYGGNINDSDCCKCGKFVEKENGYCCRICKNVICEDCTGKNCIIF